MTKSIRYLSHDEMEGLLSSLDNIFTGVIWIRDSTYQKQIYLSKNFTSIWGRDHTQIYEHPHSWFDALIDNAEFEGWRNKRIQQNCDSIYTITTQSGEIRGIKDPSFHLYNKQNQLELVVGTAFHVQHDQNDKLNLQLENEIVTFLHQKLKKIFSENLGLNSEDENASLRPVLSQRQSQLLQLIILGKTTKASAYELNLSPRTVEHYLVTLKHKFEVFSKSQLIEKAIQLGYLIK